MAAEAIAPPEDAAPTEVAAAPAKEKKEPKKGKKDKDKGPAAAPDGAPTVLGHPRAVRSIARAKSWGGLLGFALGGYLSSPTSTLAGAGLRALIAGVVCYVAVWGAAVFVWRRLVILEINAREQQLLEGVQKTLAAGRAGGPDGS